MGRIENPDLNDYGASLGWHSTSSTRAKWRSLSSARASTLKKDLTQSGIVREAIFHEELHHLAEIMPFAGFRRFNIDKFLYYGKIITPCIIAEEFHCAGIENPSRSCSLLETRA
jgi:hypothetical protein